MNMMIKYIKFKNMMVKYAKETSNSTIYKNWELGDKIKERE